MSRIWTSARTAEQIQEYISEYVTDLIKILVNEGISNDLKRIDPDIQVSHVQVNSEMLNTDTKEFAQALELIYKQNLTVNINRTIRTNFKVVYNDGLSDSFRSYAADIEMFGNSFHFWTKPADGEQKYTSKEFGSQRAATPAVFEGAIKL